jgi:hypothetical protein
MWSILEERGVIAQDNLELDPNDWKSHSDSASGIKLGLQPTPENKKSRRLFKPESFSADDEVLYKLNHEICHKFLSFLVSEKSELSGILINLFETFKVIRDSGFGLTDRSHLDDQLEIIPTNDDLAKEDLVEFIAMSLWSDEYFNDYMNYLASGDKKEERKNRKLVSLGEKTTNVLSGIRDKILLRLG